MFAHAVKGELIDKAIVAHEADDSVTVPESVHSPSEELDVWIAQRNLVSCCRVFRVRLTYSHIYRCVGAIAVVVVLAFLMRVVRRITNNYCYWCLPLPSDTSCIRLGEKTIEHGRIATDLAFSE